MSPRNALPCTTQLVLRALARTRALLADSAAFRPRRDLVARLLVKLGFCRTRFWYLVTSASGISREISRIYFWDLTMGRRYFLLRLRMFCSMRLHIRRQGPLPVGGIHPCRRIPIAEEKAKDLIIRIFLGALRRRITMTVHATLAVSGPCSWT